MSFFDQPILNSPYLNPGQHWELDENGHPTDKTIQARRKSALWTALPGASATSRNSQSSLALGDADISTDATEFNPSPIVNDLRAELDTWRSLPNPSQWKVTPITQRLLQHWRAIQLDENQTIRSRICGYLHRFIRKHCRTHHFYWVDSQHCGALTIFWMISLQPLS